VEVAWITDLGVFQLHPGTPRGRCTTAQGSESWWWLHWHSRAVWLRKWRGFFVKAGCEEEREADSTFPCGYS
jgi:hypothetical protein